MSKISTPNTFIMVCAGIKTDKSYNHVVLFNSENERFSYFQSMAVKTFERYTYQRLDKYMTVGCNAEEIEPCNYIVFRNSAFSDKVYYAFIERVEYVADNTTRIYFTIDIMQTWFPYTTTNPCFVERMHVSDDTIGANIIDDGLDCGEYVDDVYTTVDIAAAETFLCTFDKNLQDATTYNEDGLYTSLVENSFTDTGSVDSFISAVTSAGKTDGIVSCYMSPVTTKVNLDVTKPSSFQWYVPKNNKLYTYPYSYNRFFDSTGKLNACYKLEFFKAATGRQVHVRATSGQGSPELGIIPIDYKVDQVTPTFRYNYAEAVFGKPWPVCAFNVDIYKAYMAQNASSVTVENMRTAMNTATGMVQGGLNAASSIIGGATGDEDMVKATSGAIAGFSSGYNAMMDAKALLAKREDMDRLPPQTKGNQSVTLSYMLEKGVTVYGSHHTVTAEYAQMIDNYWSVYGYPIRAVTVPRIKTRRNWNYIKTAGACYQGRIPPAELQAINNIFNRGVTFWHNPATVGNYALDNSIV